MYMYQGYVQSIPEKDLQGFFFQDSHIALSTHFRWQVEYGRHEGGNLVNLFLELTVLISCVSVIVTRGGVSINKEILWIS